MGEQARQDLLERFRALSEDDRAIVVWEMLGHPVRPWTEAQELAALLGILQCPEGHQKGLGRFFVDGTVHLVVDDQGNVVPIGKRFEKQDSYDVPHPDAGMSLDGIYCEACVQLLGIDGGFFVPQKVLKTLLDD